MQTKRPRNRVAEIPMAVRQERISEMLRLFDAGLQPADIAKRMNLTAKYVHRTLHDRGRDTSAGHLQRERPSEMWEVDDEERRRMIIARAAKAAREALRASA